MNNNQVNIVEFISWLQNQGINISTNGEKLLCRVNKGTLTPALRQKIAERQAEIIVFLQQLGKGNNTNYPPIKAIPRDQKFPLSFSQERLWFIDQVEGSKAPYIEHGALEITGNLNVLVLEQALSEIINRHEVLRTSFPTINGKPIQVIHPHSTININVVDLQQYPEPERETILKQEVQREATTPFDLEVAPLIRCKLWQLDSSEYVLVLTMHHIVSDGWSMGILIEELSSLYQAFVASEPSPLPELPIQYADFALWQRQWLTGEILETQLNYWKQELEGAPKLLQLATDYPRPTAPTYQGRTESFSLNTELTQKLQTLSRDSGTTLFMTLLAAFGTLLHRYSGQEDILIGSPIANRNRREIEPLIGFFVNTLVIRTDLSGNPSFRELLRRVRSVTLDAYAHQDVPFEKLVEELQPSRSLSYNPLFQVFFNMLNLSETQLELPGVKLEQFDTSEAANSKFDLTLYAAESNQEIQLKLLYNADLFTGTRMGEMLHQFEHFLKQIVQHPQKTITDFSLVTPQAKSLLPNPVEKLSCEWSDAFHTRFDRQATRVPQQLAVIDKQVKWNYTELSNRANQLANYLLALGIKNQDVVAIVGDRSACLVWAILAVIKAGAAFMILDPAYPVARLINYLRLGKPRACLEITTDSLKGELQQEVNKLCCCLKITPDLNLEGISTDAPQVNIHLDDLAYIAFTSGSTGQPKGIEGTHRPLAHFLNWHSQTFELHESDRFSMLSGLAHDPLLRDILTPLWLGATLCIPDLEDIETPGQLACWMEQQQVSITHLTPAMAQLLFETKLTLNSLRYVFFGGDVLTQDHVSKMYKLAPCVRIVNFYGATETPQAMGYFYIPNPVDHLVSSKNTLPLGKGISNAQLLILNTLQQLAGIGEIGEIYVRTPYLARGYMGNDALTQERFIPNPFCNSNSERLYKTGDLARYLPDGNIEFIGRIDNQVKIRGFRIELGEIEAVLSTHPHIQQTVVIATEDLPGNKTLVAYIVSEEESLTAKQLREFLFQKLPDYMVPSAFVTLDTLPLTPNGKVDTKALPAPDGVFTREQEYVAPRTPTEEIIANIFALVLGVKDVGIHDNFFEIGGHSLLATQLISQLRVTFNREISLRQVFETPTIALISPKLSQLLTTENQLSLPPIQPRTDSEQLPLSSAQERLWFLNQLEGISATYNMPAALSITGNLVINALEQALSEIIHRHEVLRTSFRTINGTPIQVIHPHSTININVVDLQQYPEAERETILHQQIQQEATTPFDLEVAPLIRSKLWQLDTTEYVLVLTMHHIVSDGWSMGILIEELSSLYQAFVASEPSPLPELAIQYADFALWQRQWLSGEINENQLNYWKQELEGAPELLQLPTDHPRPHVMSYRGSSESFSLTTELTQKLQQLSRNSGSTLFMTLQAAFATLLSRYSGQKDILIGSPIANRNRQEIESLIGFFVNTLVLRTRFEDNPSFSQLLTQVRETTLLAYEHQDVPFEQVVSALQPQRSLSHAPLFQVMFVLQNAPMGKLDLPGVSLSEFNQQSTTSKFDLLVSMMETDMGLIGEWEYNTDLFDRSTIARMATHFQNLLSAIVENPQLVVGELPLLSTEERHQLLVEWNDTATEYSKEKCIHQLFEEQVEKTPDAVAVVFEQEQLTYHQLNQKANQLAHHLQNLGVGPEVLVGICVERSVQMVVGLLGILKAGGAYVPLDPNYPHQRLSYMLGDSGVEVLLTQQSLLESLPSHRARMVCLDSDWGAIDQYSGENLDVGVHSHNLAYVIYTSGSTGVPKGVAISHQALANHMRWMGQTFPLTKLDKVLQKTPFSFDASIWEFYAPLLVGAQLVIAKPEGHQDSDYLIEVINQQKITVLQLVPSLLRMLLETRNLAICKYLKRVFCGGEPLPVELYCLFKQQSQATLHNLYGPTEACIDTHFYTCHERMSKKTIPIGRPIVNTQSYILDPNLQPLPIGVPGELYLGGDGLAREYLNRPKLTSEKFIQNPFSSSFSERLYKTGDLARYLPDGNIEFIGRIDNQVKIRGFRIELGEIESVLNTHPQIQQTVVIATEDILGKKRLVAYIVSEEESLTAKQLREFLKQKLPDYMVPSAFVTLDTLPLTPNGKVDTKALPAPDGVFTREQEYVAPRTPTEEIIANIFALVLGVKDVGIHDNFFEIGGHSLLATQLISQLRVTFNREISLRQVFETPTIALISPKLSQLLTTENQLSLPPIQPRTDSEQLPLSSAQERLWFLNQLEGISATYNMPAALSITGNLVINALEQALSEIIHRHEVLRTSFRTINGTPIQVIHPHSTININVVDLQQYPEAERETILQQLVQQEATTPFDLEVAPLIRSKLWQLDTTEYVLVLTMHHIVSDGWSMGILIEELSSLYQAFVASEPSPLPELAIQYADFALWQRQWLTGEILENQLNYWKQELEAAPELLQLPTDHPRPHVMSYQGSSESFSLSTELTQKLQQLSRNSGSTLFMTLQAAFATLLSRYSGQKDILIGSPIANRNRQEIESLIGFFVNTLVLRTRFEDNPSFSQLLTQVRETTLLAYEHQDVPFEQVVSALQPQRSLSHAPLFQVMFVLQNAPMGKLDLPGVSLSEFNQQSTTSKFDLLVSMTETDMRLIGEWEYNTDLFDRSTIARMATHFQNLLSAIVENPQLVVGELPLLSAEERHQLLVEWNDTATEYSKEKCIHQLFEEQVEKTPDAVAVVFEQEQLTYHQLNQKANQLAHHLQNLGVGPEVLVGICVERSVQMVVGLLAILKAGGAYVPLDSNYPHQRLSYMLGDSGVEVLLTQQSLLESLPQNQAQVVCLDSDWGAIEQYSGENLDVGVHSHNLAYVIYTSGSTGQPKGVAMNHSPLVNLILWQLKNSSAKYGTKTGQFTPISFDVSFQEILSTWCSGGTLVLIPEDVRRDGTALLQLLKQQGIERLFLPFVALEYLATSALTSPECLPSTLCELITAGEQLQITPTLRNFFEKLSNCRLENQYGPTETHVVSAFKLNGFPSDWSSLPPIGRPIANTQIYILDKNLEPVPIGVPGELYLGGDGLARGYLNRPELTSEKFIPNPLCSSFSERLYKTGDLARYRRDGNIEFLGRIDNQVKIRGFRIELGEIESVLSTHPHIQQTAVIVTEDVPGHKRLVAYYVSQSESLSTKQLREFLFQKLPDYMVPSAFVTLDTLPLTPNGKVDRKSLPAPDGEIAREHKYVAARTTIELQLTQIWSDVLNLTSVGVQDNFFELGGHSLNAVRLMSQIQQQFQINLPLATLFQSPTIEQLASLLGSSVNTQNPILVGIKTSGNQTPLFCIHPVGGNVLCYAELARHLAQDYPVYGLQSLGLDGQQQPLTSVEEMASHYIEAIKPIHSQGPLHLIGWSFGGVIAYEMAQQLQAKNEPVALLTLIDSYAPTLIRKPSEIDQAMIVNLLAQDLGGLYGQELDISHETLRQLEASQQVLHLFEQAKQQGIFPSDLEIEQMRSLWEVFQANLAANSYYQPQAYPGSVLLLNASQTSPAGLEDPTHGWGSLVLGDIQTHTITGDHFTIMKAPQVEGLTAELNNYLLNN
ncbi:amino acid adenylation domain-containing protein [Moorena producens JHB]|uniref:Amino acid adenylation domain-containing protein n=1 Tax=Moorena producens (strain JHB) TaxID=1454205 RepID=A0A9Q9STQ8_MOOP1|nr:non-ribosomal peptide synthetase [Moorena producens]WAN69458.1 amino acid adenylation domain-containing protein [Moorena producens JHB]